MKIGTICSIYREVYPKNRVYEEIRKDGYEGIDFQGLLNTERELFRVSEAEFEKRLLEEKKMAEDCGIEIYQCHGPWRYPVFDSTEEERSERMEKMQKSIRGTAILGCDKMILHPIMPYGTKKGPDAKRFREINLEFYRKLLLTAHEYGVTVCYENMPMQTLEISTPADCLDFVNEINDPNLALCLDTGHSIVLGIQPGTALRQIKDKVKALHIHDSDGYRDRHYFPGYGIIDWSDFAKALREINYQGFLSSEAERDLSTFGGPTSEALHKLASIMKDLKEAVENAN